MKFYSLFVLCFCITIAAGSHNYGHPLLMSLPQHHAVKRQANPDQEEVCENLLQSDLCNNGYYEDFAYLSALCHRMEAAETFRSVCSFNSMGTTCITIDVPNFDDFNSMCDSVNTTCSSGCMDFLTSTRARLGCCLNEYNSTDSTIFSYALWSLCGVEPVTEQCTPSFDFPTGTDPTCNQDNFEERLYPALCRVEFLDSLRNALHAGNCDDTRTSLDDVSLCAVDEQDSYCAIRDNLYAQQDTASNNCRDTVTCDPVCIDTLNNIISISGCCFISEFNSTIDDQMDWLSYEFWQRCGLTSPGFCEQRFTSGPRISSSALRKAPGITIILTTIALFVVLLVPSF